MENGHFCVYKIKGDDKFLPPIVNKENQDEAI